MLVGVENAGQPRVLARGEQLQAGAPDPIQRITGMAAPAQGLLLDALADQVELGPGQATTWKGLCRYRHNPFYAEVRIMPMWGGLRMVTAVTASVRSA